MIKECQVLVNNNAVTVVDYNGVKVQLPSIHRNDKTVFILYKDGRYKVVDRDYKEEVIETTTKQKAKRKRKPVVPSEPADQE